MFQQIFAVTGMNLRNIPSRWSTSLVVVVGIGGVVAVLVAVLSMAAGLANVFDQSVSTDRAVVVRSGSTSELSSNLNFETSQIISTMEGVDIAAPEMYVVADVPKKSTGEPANMVVRGVNTSSFDIRPKLKVVDGRLFETGRNEVIVGVQAHAEFANLDIGSSLEMRESMWQVVGVFEAEGAVSESEVWADLTVAQAAFRRADSITAVRVQLDSPSDFKTVKALIKDDPRLATDMVGEEDWFSTQSETATIVIRVLAYTVAVIMSVGAIFAALNTMYSAVAVRTFEIATLRAIGFRGGAVLTSVMVESLFLALVGGLIGGAIAYFGFNGFTASTLSNVTFSQIAFQFAVTPELLIAGVVLSVALGFVGGVFPAVRAIRLPVTVALRGE